MLDRSKPYSEERTLGGLYYVQDGKRYYTDGSPIAEDVDTSFTPPFDVETATPQVLKEMAVNLGIKIDGRWSSQRLRDEVRQALSV